MTRKAAWLCIAASLLVVTGGVLVLVLGAPRGWLAPFGIVLILVLMPLGVSD